MAQKSVSLPAVRIEPEYRDALERIAEVTRPEPSVSALVRLAVVEFIGRHWVKAEWSSAAFLDDHEPMGVIPS